MSTFQLFLFIILGVVIIVLGYLVYVQYFNQTNSVNYTMWLMNDNKPITSNIVNPTSSIFSYSFWMYINTWPGKTPANIFNCKNGQNINLFSVDLPDTTPSLACSVATGSNDTCNPKNQNTQIVTNNLGIQRWVYVIISVNANIVDCYLDGKLVLSFQTNGMPNPSISCTQKTNNWGINFGKGSDIYISGFTRVATATDPATALRGYATKPAGAKTSTAYSANLQINQNNQLLTTWKLF
jgi:hypothetical protein